MNRRSFIAASAGLTGGFLPNVRPASGAPQAERQFQLGCVTYNLLKDMDLETIITTLEAAGLVAVELRTTHKHGVEPSIGPAERAKVRERFQRSKVRLLSYGTECEFESPDPAVRKRQVEIGKTFVDLAKDVGAMGVKVRPYGWGTEPDHQITTRHIGECLRELGEYAAPKNVEVWLEFHDEGHKEDRQMMEIAGLKNVGLTWNSAEQDIENGSVKPCFDMQIGRAHV